jgi:hypothetical protein
MQAGQRARRRRVLAYLEDAIGALDFIPGAPPGNKGASQRGIVEIDRDCIAQDAVQAGGRRLGG